MPDKFDAYWQLTLKFLQIAREAWPLVLREAGFIEPAARRDLLIKAEAARLARKTDGPVIAAGSTGSIPATADLIATIAHLPHGAVVLPGLDTDLDEASWRLIAGDEERKIAPVAGHPQFAMQALLTRIGMTRAQVVPLAAARGRERLVSEALRPAAATDLWRQTLVDPVFAAHADAALATLSVIEAANPEDEALAIAVALREAVQDGGKTAALVTPDRALGRRVLAALQRWNIAVEDSGGDALADTPAGIFARLAAAAALGGLEPVTLLALLKHPLLRLGTRDREHTVATLERAVLRGPRPRAGSTGLAPRAGEFSCTARQISPKEPVDLHHSDPRTELTDSELAAAVGLVSQLAGALGPLESVRRAPHSVAELAARHRDVVAALSQQDGNAAAFAGPAGTQLADALDELATSEAAEGLLVEKSDYVELFAAALCRPGGAPAAAAGTARAYPRSARSAPDRERPRRARRSRRGNLAAGKQHRRLAQPPDAARARPRFAGTPHRADRA